MPSFGKIEERRPTARPYPQYPEKKVRAVVEATLHTTPEAPLTGASAQWPRPGHRPDGGSAYLGSIRSQVSSDKTFKLSGDKRFVEKLYDVVGLYLNLQTRL